jgi:hypothetical protein
MTSPATTATEPEDQDAAPPKLGLGAAQIAASALAAVTSALAASFLGVAGTIIGAAVGSVVATVGSAVYAHSLQTAGSRLRELRPASSGQASRRARVVTGPEHGPAPRRPRERRALTRLMAVVVGVFVVALGGITAAEAVMGHPVSSSSTAGTTLSRVVGDGAQTPRPQRDGVPDDISTSQQSSTANPSTSGPAGAPTSSAVPTGSPAPGSATTTGQPADPGRTSTAEPSTQRSAQGLSTPSPAAPSATPTASAVPSAPAAAPDSRATTAAP